MKVAKWSLNNLETIKAKTTGLDNMSVFRNTSLYEDYVNCTIKDLNGKPTRGETEKQQNYKSILSKLSQRSVEGVLSMAEKRSIDVIQDADEDDLPVVSTRKKGKSKTKKSKARKRNLKLTIYSKTKLRFVVAVHQRFHQERKKEKSKKKSKARKRNLKLTVYFYSNPLWQPTIHKTIHHGYDSFFFCHLFCS